MLPQLKNFKVLDQLGEGSFATVYKVERDGIILAVKLSKKKDLDGQILRSFKIEAATMRMINHPAIVHVEDVDVMDLYPYMVMERVSFPTLANFLEQAQPFREAEALIIAQNLAQVLEAVHSSGIVHRDVQPRNIYWDAEGNSLKLSDFGLASGNGKETKQFAGTALYMSPEQAGGLAIPVDYRSDLYSLGVLLFHLLAGYPPYQGADAFETLRMHLTAKTPHLDDHNPKVTQTLSQIVRKLMSKDPDDRYQSAGGLIFDLERLSKGRTLIAIGTGDSLGKKSSSPIIGRSTELAALDQYLSASAGSTGAALITGHPGSGKSRLAQEALRQAVQKGTAVFYAKCSKGKILHALRQVFAVIKVRITSESADRRHLLATELKETVRANVANLDLIEPGLAEALSLDPVKVPSRPSDSFPISVAAILRSIARHFGDMVLFIDDVQWADDSSRDVFIELSQKPASDGVKLIVTGRGDEQSHAAVKRFIRRLPEDHSVFVDVANLDRSNSAELVSVTLGGLTVPSTFVDHIFRATAGNPFSIGEYIRNTLLEGILSPKGGSWSVDEQRLKAVDLPANAIELVKRRIGVLDKTTQKALVVAAVLGSSFTAMTVAAICEIDVSEVERHLGMAERSSMLTRDGQKWRFFHDRVREAVLLGVETEDIKNIHDQIAQYLEQGQEGVRDNLTLAHHYREGHVEKCPVQAFRVLIAAAGESQATNSMGDALGFFKLAEALAAKFGLAMDSHWEQAASVYSECGLKAECIERLKKALALTTDRHQRARILGIIARRYVERLDQGSSEKNMRNAFREIRWSYPILALDIIPGIVSLILGEILIRLRKRPLRLRGSAEVRARIIVDLHETFGFSQFFALNALTGMIGTLRVYALGQCIGQSIESVKLTSSIAILGAALKLRKGIDALYLRAKTMAISIGDAGLVSYVNVYYAVALAVYGDEIDAEKTIERIAAEEQDSISPEVFVFLCAFYASSSLMRGHPEQALEYALKGISKLSDTEQFRDHGEYFMPWCYDFAVTALMMMGRYSETQPLRARIDAQSDPHPKGTYHQAIYLNNKMQRYLEQSEFSALVENDFSDHDALKIFIPTAVSTVRQFYVSAAYLRLNQYYLARNGAKKIAYSKLKKSMRKLRLCADTDIFKSHFYVIRGALARLKGNIVKSNRDFGTAEYHATKIRNNLALCEIAIWKARAEARSDAWEGVSGVARELAQQAYEKLRSSKLHARAEQIAHEFRLSQTRSGSGVSANRSATDSRGELEKTYTSNGGQSLIQSSTARAMQALIAVGRAVANNLDTDDQARLVLDETIAVTGGERAALFYVSPDRASQPAVARDASRSSIKSFKNFSTSVIDKVVRDQMGVSYNGGDDSAFSNSSSIVLNDIRSALAAPVKVNGSVHGVIYVDTNVVKGVFGQSELEILEAIAQQLGVAIESSRAASLELEKQAMERDLEVTGSVQKLLIPQSSSLKTAHFDLNFLYQSASRAGGDWVWYQEMEHDRLVVLVGDVTGHGPGPAIITGLVSGAFQVCARQKLDLKDAFAVLNETIVALTKGEVLMTLMAVEIDPRKQVLRCINAGSPRLYVGHPETIAFESLTLRSNPLGLLDDFAVAEQEMPFVTGSRVMLFTDGAYEIRGQGQVFGIRRLFDAFKVASPASASEAIRSIESTVKGFGEKIALDDDITMLIVDFRSAEKGT